MGRSLVRGKNDIKPAEIITLLLLAIFIALWAMFRDMEIQAHRPVANRHVYNIRVEGPYAYMEFGKEGRFRILGETEVKEEK